MSRPRVITSPLTVPDTVSGRIGTMGTTSCTNRATRAGAGAGAGVALPSVSIRAWTTFSTSPFIHVTHACKVPESFKEVRTGLTNKRVL
jgi:hypothetical protein